MNFVELHVPGVPQPKGSLRAFRMPRRSGLVVTSANPKLRAWETAVYKAALAARPSKRFMGPVAVELWFRLPRPKRPRAPHPQVRPDLDKLVRGSLDPLSGVIYNDDAQIVDVQASKRYCASGEWPSVNITVREV